MYGKYFASTFTGSMFGAGTDVFAIWGYVIANAVESQIEINPQYVAAVLGATPEQIVAALAVLCGPDNQSRSQAEDGRRLVHEAGMTYRVVNHAVYRAMRNEDDRRAYNRDAKRRERARVKQSVNDKHGLSSVSAHTEAEAETEAVRTDSPRAREPESVQSVYQVSSTSKPVKPQPLHPRRRRDAAWEGPRVYVPQRLHTDLLGLRQGTAGSDVERELWTWYSAVSVEWTDGPRRGEEPGADMFVFWRARYAERWPATQASPPRATAPMPRRAEWRTECAEQSHDPPCPTPERHELRKVVAETCQHWGVCESLAECQAKGGA